MRAARNSKEWLEESIWSLKSVARRLLTRRNSGFSIPYVPWDRLLAGLSLITSSRRSQVSSLVFGNDPELERSLNI
jgi:hypothetical protein